MLLALLAVLILFAPAAAAQAHLTVTAPDGAPATAFLEGEVQGPADVTLVVPPDAQVTALTVNGSAAAWRYADAAHLVVPIPNGTLPLALHLVLPGNGPWRLGGIAPLTVDAPDGYHATVGDDGVALIEAAAPAPAMTVGLTIAGAMVVAVVAAMLLAARDRRRHGAPETLLGHLRELSARVKVALVALVVLLLFFATFGVRPLFDLTGATVWVPFPGQPTVAEEAYHALAVHLVPAGVSLVVLRPMDAVMAELWVALLLAAVAGLPVLAYQAAAFLGPALLPGERRLVRVVLVPVVLLFAAGVAFALLFVVPTILRTLYGFAPGLGATALLNAPEVVTFAAVLALVMGLVFETPLVMAALARAGVVSPGTMGGKWRHAVVVIFILAAFITPDPTVVSQLFIAVPMTVLYLVGVAVAYLVAPREAPA